MAKAKASLKAVEVTAPWERNRTLQPALIEAMDQYGIGLFRQVRFAMKFRRMSEADQRKVEVYISSLIITSGLVAAGDPEIVGSVFVGDYGRGEILQLLLDHLPQILEFIMKIIPLFFMSTWVILILVGALSLIITGAANAQCAGGVCRPVQRAKQVVVEKQTVRTTVKRVVNRERRPFLRIFNRR